MSDKNKITLLAGNPNDDNRDYLPEAIKGSDMVVNENGNNSQVYPARLKEYREVLFGTEESIWYEYVPESYRPGNPTPLVFSMHGGLMTGWGQAIYTSWTHVADKEGFIVVFPSAAKRRFWTIECEKSRFAELSAPNPSGVYMNPFPDDIRENIDANFVLFLMKRMQEKYSIDSSRIYMQGMSLGNAMTYMIARYYGDRFAAMAGAAGPAAEGLIFDRDGKPVTHTGHLAAWQSRGEYDNIPPGSDLSYEDAVVKNREYWMILNECEELPELSIIGEDNFAFYTGRKAPYVFRDIKNRDHGQTFDDAQLVWDYLFSGTRRLADGTIELLKENCKREGDRISLAVAENCGCAWVNQKKTVLPGKVFRWKKLKYHGLEGGSIVRGEYLMVPASSLAEMCGGICRAQQNGQITEIQMPDGTALQFARGCIGAVVNNRICSMLCEAVWKDGILYLPAEWFFYAVCHLRVTQCSGVLYATDHEARLSGNMARLIKDLLGE